MRRVLAICNRKGGCGKTTTAVNLAAGLANRGNSVLIVDADSQAHTTLSLGTRPGREADLASVLLSPRTAPQALVPTYLSNLKLIPASKRLAAYEKKYGQRNDLLPRLNTALGGFNGQFDYVIIDTPPVLGHITVAALLSADEVIVPTQMHYLSMEGLAEMVTATARIGQMRGRHLPVSGVVPTFFNERMRLSRAIVSEITQQLGEKSILGPIRTNVALAEAPAYGQTVFQYDNRSNGAVDYMRLATQVEGRHGDKT